MFSSQFHSEMNHDYPASLSALHLAPIPHFLGSLRGYKHKATAFPSTQPASLPWLTAGQTDCEFSCSWDQRSLQGWRVVVTALNRFPDQFDAKRRQLFLYQQKGWAGHSGKAITPSIINLKETGGLKQEASRSLK